MRAGGSQVTTDLGWCRSNWMVVRGRADMKANESFVAAWMLLRVVEVQTSPIRGNQMPLTYFRKIVALTIVVVDRRMFADR